MVHPTPQVMEHFTNTSTNLERAQRWVSAWRFKYALSIPETEREHRIKRHLKAARLRLRWESRACFPRP